MIEQGAVLSVRTARNLLARFQIVEYLRAFLAGRTALSFADTLLVISGAFGMFRRAVVVEIGGYRLDTVGEDMELVLRIHRYCGERQLPCRIRFISDSVCWTEVPESVRVLRRQRIRWQRGCLECLLFHKSLIGNARYGAVGLLGLPYFLLCEVIGPLVEVVGYLTTLAGLLLGLLSLASALLFFAVSVLFGLMLSVGFHRKSGVSANHTRLACPSNFSGDFEDETILGRDGAARLSAGLRVSRACARGRP